MHEIDARSIALLICRGGRRGGRHGADGNPLTVWATLMSDAHHERVLRGIPRWLLVEFLEGLGGTAIESGGSSGLGDEEDLVAGDGWQAHLMQMDDHKVGFLRSEQVKLVVTGDPDEVRGMLSRLAPRLGRNGS